MKLEGSIGKLFNYLIYKGEDTPREKSVESKNQSAPSKASMSQAKIKSSLQTNLDIFKKEFNSNLNEDIVIREFNIGKKVGAFLIFIEGMTDKVTVNRDILPTLMTAEIPEELEDKALIDYLLKNVITINSVSKEKYLNKINLQLVNGLTVLIVDNCSECILIETRGYEKRNIEKPITETVVAGSQEAFTENLRTNTALIRKIIRNKKLITEIMQVGKMNNSSCAVMYIDGFTNKEVVAEVKRRINGIDVDSVQGDGMLTQLIEDNPMMIFPSVLSTERPDRAASFLLEGQVIVIAEGTPFAEAVPVTFYHFLHTPEESFLKWQLGFFLRLIRTLGCFCSLFLPALYVALTSFHQEMIPTELLSNILKAKQQVPFPTIIEIMLLELSFELIREGGIRVPGAIGQTLGIVGALILGQAAVAAGLVSPVLIIIVALTGLGNFAIPNYIMGVAIRALRFFFTFLAALLGFLGISIGIAVVGAFFCHAKSFGVPFLSPIAPKSRGRKDLFLKYPAWKQEEYPDFLDTSITKRHEGKTKKWKE